MGLKVKNMSRHCAATVMFHPSEPTGSYADRLSSSIWFESVYSFNPTTHTCWTDWIVFRGDGTISCDTEQDMHTSETWFDNVYEFDKCYDFLEW